MPFNIIVPQHGLVSPFNFIATLPYGVAVITLTGFMSAADLCKSLVNSQSRAASVFGREKGGRWGLRDSDQLFLFDLILQALLKF